MAFTCKKCQKEVKSDAKFCSNCGQSDPAKNHAKKEENSGGFMVYVYSFLALFFVLILFSALIDDAKDKANKDVSAQNVDSDDQGAGPYRSGYKTVTKETATQTTKIKPSGTDESFARVKCQLFFETNSFDEDRADIPSVQPVVDASLFMYAWGASTEYMRLPNRTGDLEYASGSCWIDRKSGEIVRASLNGKTIIEME